MSFYQRQLLLSKATDGNFFVSKDFCYSIGDGVFKEQIIDKIIVQQEEKQAKVQGETQEADKSALLGIRLENRTDDYDGDLVFTGFNQSEAQEETAREEQEEQEAVQETAAQGEAVQEDAVQVADKPNFDPASDDNPTVGTETAANFDANDNAVDAVEVAFTLETPLVTLRDRAISAFLDYLVNHCNDVKHVALEDEETRIEAAKNEKFAMRAWFTQLGWRGKEDNELRSYFYDNLEGNTAFRTEEDHARWAAKWQPKYFDKHPEMKWVLEKIRAEKVRKAEESEEFEVSLKELKDSDQLEQVEEYQNSVELLESADWADLAESAETEDSAYAAETAEAIETATAETAETLAETAQEGQEATQETAQEAIEQTEAVETASELAAEAELSSESEESEFKPEVPEVSEVSEVAVETQLVSDIEPAVSTVGNVSSEEAEAEDAAESDIDAENKNNTK